jgi:penicillin V acylase-like amidase (Ntn superfamily)
MDTGVFPIQMQNNKELEVNYSVEKLAEQTNIENQSGYSVDIGDRVQLIENKQTMKKTRYNVTPFYFIISDISGKSIIISSADGSAKTATR